MSAALPPSAGLPLVSPTGQLLTTSLGAEREDSFSPHPLLHWLHLGKDTKKEDLQQDVKSRPEVTHWYPTVNFRRKSQKDMLPFTTLKIHFPLSKGYLSICDISIIKHGISIIKCVVIVM